MCVEIKVGDSVATTKGELAKLIGVTPLLDTVFYAEPFADDYCLCPCDLEATAKTARMTLVMTDSMEGEMKPLTVEAGKPL